MTFISQIVGITTAQRQALIVGSIAAGTYFGPGKPRGYGLAKPGETHIAELGLSSRTFNALFRGGLFTLEDILEYTDDDLLEVRSFGRGCLEELRIAIERRKQLLDAQASYNQQLPSFRCGGQF